MKVAMNPIQSAIYGPNPFHANAASYAATMESEFAQAKPPREVSYTFNTSRFNCIKTLIPWVVFPIGIFRCLHALAGKLVLTSSRESNTAAARQKKGIVTHLKARNAEGWKFKRLTIMVDGCRIDATIMGKAETLQNRSWVLASNGRGGMYEHKFDDRGLGFREMLDELESNAIIFNYPGVGGSSGYFPQRKTMAKAYRAMLAFLEDPNGVGAKEIIGYGYSIGGLVQGEALRTHRLKPWNEIKSAFVKNKSCSNFCAAASTVQIPGRPMPKKPERGFRWLVVKLLGWNLSSRRSSKMMQVPEIIRHSDQDEVIGNDASLPKALLGDKNCPMGLKKFISTTETHTPEFGVNGNSADAVARRKAAVKELVDYIKHALNRDPLTANAARS